MNLKETGQWVFDHYIVGATSSQMPTPEVTELLMLAAVVLATLWLLKRFVYNTKIWWNLRQIPMPPGNLPIFGHALAIGAGAPWDCMLNWAREYGKEETKNLLQINFLGNTGIIVTDPEQLKHVMDKKQRNYAKDIGLSYKPFLHILGTGLVTSMGESWKKQRKLMAGTMRQDILEETADVAKRAVDRLTVKLEKYRGTGKPVEIAEEFRVLTLQVIGELILSLPPDESERVFPELYLPIVEEANIRVWQPWRPWIPNAHNRKYNKTVDELNKYVSDLIRDRWAKRVEIKKAGKEAPMADILDRAMSAIDPDAWGEHSVKQLRDEIKTFLLAGHETSASMLTWSLFELSQNKETLQKTVDEGNAVFAGRGKADGKVDDMPSKGELQELKYTVAVLKESLRKYTLVPMVTRVSLEDDVMDGHTIPAGTKVFINMKAVHMNPKLWPDPLVFKPERFQEKFDPWNFNAFINGPRNCLGQHLALLEARIVLSLLHQRFKFTPVDPVKAGEVHTYMVPTCPANGMHVLVE
eukprot:gene691-20261_t